jgi:hypothetical protein
MGTSTAWEAGKMAIRTVFTERFQVTHPLVLAPMGGIAPSPLTRTWDV